MKNNNVLVTGGGGFVGLALVQELCRQGRAVRVLGRHRYPAAEAVGAISLQGDIRNLESVQRAAAGCDTVFHVAAKAGIWGGFHEYYSINVLGTLNVLAACQNLGIGNLVYTSTPSVVFDGHDLEGEDESLPYSSKPTHQKPAAACSPLGHASTCTACSRHSTASNPPARVPGTSAGKPARVRVTATPGP